MKLRPVTLDDKYESRGRPDLPDGDPGTGPAAAADKAADKISGEMVGTSFFSFRSTTDAGVEKELVERTTSDVSSERVLSIVRGSVWVAYLSPSSGRRAYKGRSSITSSKMTAP